MSEQKLPNSVIINDNVVAVLRDWQQELADTLFSEPQPGSSMTVTAMLHRSAGKTYIASLLLFLACLGTTLPKAKAAFVAPHLKQARNLVKFQIEDFARAAGIRLKWDGQDNQFIFPNGAILMLGATENNSHEIIRGNRFEIGMVLDEAAFMGAALDALLPTLKGGRREGFLLAVGTPQSLGDPLSILYGKGLDPALPNHKALRYSVYDTGLFSPEEIVHWEASMASELAWRREGLADPEAGAEDAVCPISLVREAQRRKHPEGGRAYFNTLPHVFGIDPSRSANGDGCILVRRNGNVVYPAIDLPSGNAVTTCTAIARQIDSHKPDAVFMDAGGIGGPMVDMLMDWGYEITAVDFGAKSPESGFAQMRSWMWWQMRDFLKTAVLPEDDPELAAELTGPTWKHVASTGASGRRIQVEPKERMKKRGLSSPDRADALALACSFPVSKVQHDPVLREYERRFESINGYRPLDGSAFQGGDLDSLLDIRTNGAPVGDYDPFN